MKSVTLNYQAQTLTHPGGWVNRGQEKNEICVFLAYDPMFAGLWGYYS